MKFYNFVKNLKKNETRFLKNKVNPIKEVPTVLIKILKIVTRVTFFKTKLNRHTDTQFRLK